MFQSLWVTCSFRHICVYFLVFSFCTTLEKRKNYFSLFPGAVLGAGEAEVRSTSVLPVLKAVQGSSVGQDS